MKPTAEEIKSVMTYLGSLGGRAPSTKKARHSSFNIVNAAVNGKKGGSSGFGKAKLRGNKAYYATLAKKRWAKKAGG